MKVTIRDVAREARVSIATVSRAMNGLSNVTPETRDRIRAMADQLGYVPHAAARALSLSRTNVIGVMLPDLHGEFFSELVRGMNRAAAERGYHLLFSTVHADAGGARHAMMLVHGRCDGLVLMLPEVSPGLVDALLPPRTAAVLINTGAGPAHDRLRIDNREGARRIARHLFETGRRRIVHLTGPLENIDARERREGFAQGLQACSPSLEPIIVRGDFQEAAGDAAVRSLLARDVPFDAIFAANDGMALGVLQALKAAGRGVPDDVAVAGFDDIPLARFLELTTMRVPMLDLGALAVERLCDRLEDEDAEMRETVVVPELVVRRSTGARP